MYHMSRLAVQIYIYVHQYERSPIFADNVQGRKPLLHAPAQYLFYAAVLFPRKRDGLDIQRILDQQPRAEN